MAPVMVTGKGLTLPRPRFSLFLWLLKSLSSLFSSSSRELQYRTWSRKEGFSQTDSNLIYMWKRRHFRICKKEQSTGVKKDLLARTHTHTHRWQKRSHLVVVRWQLVKELLDAMFLSNAVHIRNLLLRQRAVILMNLQFNNKKNLLICTKHTKFSTQSV